MSQTRRYNFPARLRIKKRQDFLTVRNLGRRFRTQHFFIHLFPSGRDESRLGVTVSRKIGNAVTRNRVKRLLREFFRLHYDDIPTGVDISIVARRRFTSLNLAGVTEELNILLGLTLDR